MNVEDLNSDYYNNFKVLLRMMLFEFTMKDTGIKYEDLEENARLFEDSDEDYPMKIDDPNFYSDIAIWIHRYRLNAQLTEEDVNDRLCQSVHYVRSFCSDMDQERAYRDLSKDELRWRNGGNCFFLYRLVYSREDHPNLSSLMKSIYPISKSMNHKDFLKYVRSK